ncbi:hypothetical protein G9A89_023961 [Geosiphon pyriformis]|nr:hypothetical protein G9A89_023961 [Geosiphon pyriformis]
MTLMHTAGEKKHYVAGIQQKRPSNLNHSLLFLILMVALLFYNLSNSTTMTAAPSVNETKPRKTLVVWVKHPQHSDAVKLHVPPDADVHDVKKYIRLELTPALDQESLGKVLLLSPTRGKLSPDTPIKKVIDRREPLIVFVDNTDSRLYLKKLTTEQVPLQVNAPLCVKSEEAYIVIAKILLRRNSPKDLTVLKNNLCDASVESWSSRHSYTHRDGRYRKVKRERNRLQKKKRQDSQHQYRSKYWKKWF